MIVKTIKISFYFKKFTIRSFYCLVYWHDANYYYLRTCGGGLCKLKRSEYEFISKQVLYIERCEN